MEILWQITKGNYLTKDNARQCPLIQVIQDCNYNQMFYANHYQQNKTTYFLSMVSFRRKKEKCFVFVTHPQP